MGKRHNTLSDDIFRNSKYINVFKNSENIKALERELEIEKFKKKYEEQYSIMLDIFKTLIVINNIIFADSNRNIDDKITDTTIEIENCIYKDLPNDEEIYFYSVRTIKKLIDSHTRYLFYKFVEWKNHLNDIGTLDLVKQEVEEEMQKLESIGFDEIEKGNLHYEKNKNSDYKIYISKLGNLYTENKAILEQYKNDFNNDYGIDLNNEELRQIALIYDLVAYANNGITNTLFNKEIQNFDLTERNCAEDYYKAYLTSLKIDIKDDEAFKKNSDKFLKSVISVSQSLSDDTDQKIDMNKYIANFDLYFFLVAMQDFISGEVELSVKTDLINKLFNDLKDIYNLMTKETEIEEEKELNYKEALGKIQPIIERNKKLYERLS